MRGGAEKNALRSDWEGEYVQIQFWTVVVEKTQLSNSRYSNNMWLGGCNCELPPKTKTLDELAPPNKIFYRGNKVLFINKTMKKAFMKRNHLRNIYLKNRSDNNKHEYNN